MKKKITAICLVVALAAIAVIGGTLAFFTDVSGAKENTFTFGKVDIELTETAAADETKGYIAGKAGTNGFDYENILPGLKYAKKPVITVTDDSLNAYVFAELIVSNYSKLYTALTAAGVDATKLDALLVGANLGTGVVIDNWLDDNDCFHIVYTNGEMAAEATWTLFEAVAIPEGFTQEQIATLTDGVTLSINAYAVQADGIADAATAWPEVDPVPAT